MLCFSGALLLTASYKCATITVLNALRKRQVINSSSVLGGRNGKVTHSAPAVIMRNARRRCKSCAIATHCLGGQEVQEVAATAAGGKTCHQRGHERVPLPFDADNAISARCPLCSPRHCRNLQPCNVSFLLRPLGSSLKPTQPAQLAQIAWPTGLVAAIYLHKVN